MTDIVSENISQFFHNTLGIVNTIEQQCTPKLTDKTITLQFCYDQTGRILFFGSRIARPTKKYVGTLIFQIDMKKYIQTGHPDVGKVIGTTLDADTPRNIGRIIHESIRNYNRTIPKINISAA